MPGAAAATSKEAVPAVQRLFLACAKNLRGLPPSASREARVESILKVLNGVSAADVGLFEPPEPTRRSLVDHSSQATTSRDALACTSAELRQAGGQKPSARKPIGSLTGLLGLAEKIGGGWPNAGSSLPPVVTYLHIFEDEAFSIGIFCLPSLSCIPLHDHPGMTVLSKLLYGSLHVRAYDWVSPPSQLPHGTQQWAPTSSSDNSQSFGGLAEAVRDEVVEGGRESQSLVLHPSSGGNLHEFTALSDCAVLDVLTPPYDPWVGGRNCTYYMAREARRSESQGLSGKKLYWLQPCNTPSSFRTQEGRYRGPKVSMALGPASLSRSMTRFNLRLHKTAADLKSAWSCSWRLGRLPL